MTRMADPAVKETPAAEAGPAPAPESSVAKAADTTPAATEESTTAVPVVAAAPSAEKAATPSDTAAPAAAAAAAKPVEQPNGTLLQELWLEASRHPHKEIWGVTLADPASHVPSQVVLQKYLNANDGDVARARDQLTGTLDWRAKTKPLELLEKDFSAAKFAGLGYVTVHKGGAGGNDSDPEQTEVFTWNIYGAVKDMNETFGVLEE